MHAGNDILDAIGNRPLVELRNLVPGGHARVLVKLESQNPTGSMKDRMAQAVITGALRKRTTAVQIMAVGPAESAVLAGSEPGPHRIEGVGPGFVPPIWREGLADGGTQVTTAEAMDMTLRLAREEALFAGTSTGANVLAAIRIARRLGPGHTVATLACDSGLKYLSTDLYTST